MQVGRFTQGSIVRHIVTMTLTSTVGLLALFVVDLIDLYFLSLLEQDEITAAIGFASALLFYMTAICLGCQVAAGAVVAKAEGAKDRPLSMRLFSHSMVLAFLTASVFAFGMWRYCEPLLSLLGAKGQTLAYAVSYSRITLASTPLLAVGMTCAATLRSLGDARGSMYAIVSGAVINGVLDPLLIFGAGWGVEGAAWATVGARVGIVATGLICLMRAHQLGVVLQPEQLRADSKRWSAVALAAMLTNMATPLGSSIIMKAIAPYGADAVAAVTIVARITPVAFALLFSLSGAIGPIIGQNAGALLYDRVKLALKRTLMLVIAYVLLVWVILSQCSELITRAFYATGLTAQLVDFYTHVLVLGALFNALLFIANAAMNNLGKAHMATLFNFSRSLLGIFPAVLVLQPLYGAYGVMAAEAAGQVVFGVLAYSYVWWLVSKESAQHDSRMVST